MWKFDPSKGLEPIPGLPLEAPDSTFEAAVARIEGKSKAAMDAIIATGIYVHVADPKPTKEEA